MRGIAHAWRESVPNDKIFIKSFCIVALLLLAANIWSLIFPNQLQDGFKEIGFPMVFYREGGFSYHTEFKWLALGSDLVFCLNVSIFASYLLVEALRKK